MIEPATLFVGGWHLDAVCDHLEAVTRGAIRNLVILIPPRHTKSILTSVCWPVWDWIAHPAHRFLFASYSAGLSTEHAVLSRRILDSPWYQARWGKRFRLTTDQNVKTHYENTKRGVRISTSVGGTVTGHGADFLVLDDPHNLDAIHSETSRAAVHNFYTKVWHSRLNDPKTGGRVCIMQRGHMDDLAGHMVEAFGYEALMLPTEYDPVRATVTSLGFTDPREAPGDVLCPDRFGPAEVAEAKRILGRDFETQHNQNPQPEAGLLFKRAWFKLVDALPAQGRLKTCRGWDCAATEPKLGTDPDYTVGTKIAHFSDGLYYVEDVIRGRWSPGVVDQTIRQTAELDGPRVRIREEQEGGHSGKNVIASHTRMLAGYDYQGQPATGAKTTRWRPFAVQAEAGNVRLLTGAWNQAWLEELTSVPAARHDDQADSAALAFEAVALGYRAASVARTREGG